MQDTSEKTYVEARDLFDDVAEGDLVTWDGREEPLTVYRHVTEDDLDGQIITMRELSEHHAEQQAWLAENTNETHHAELEAGDLMTGSQTGEEFLVVRGPRGGAYLLTQRWSKYGGTWSAVTDLYRRTRKENKVWDWENDITLSVVGHEEVDRDEFDAGGPWVRHTEMDGRAIWEDAETLWEHHDAHPETRSVTLPEPPEAVADLLADVQEGDEIQVNGGIRGTVTEVRCNDGGVLADGMFFKLDGEDGPFSVKTYSDEGNAAFMWPEGSGEVETVTVTPAEDADR